MSIIPALWEVEIELSPGKNAKSPSHPISEYGGAHL
jgi:hypothetical protein